MIVEYIVSFVMAPFLLLMDGYSLILPVITLPAKFFSGAVLLLDYVAWILPIGELLPLFIIRLLLESLNILWKVILRIKSFIPTMGG